MHLRALPLTTHSHGERSSAMAKTQPLALNRGKRSANEELVNTMHTMSVGEGAGGAQ